MQINALGAARAGGFEVTAKEYLNQVRLADRQIKVKLSELHSLKLNSAQISPQAKTDRVQTSSTCDVMKTVDKIVDMQNEINREIDNLVDLKREVRGKINQLDDNRYVLILTEYYINGKTWEKVAEDNNFSDRHVRRLHGWALQAFRKKYDLF